MTTKNIPEISVCICTYKRPALLLKLIESLAQQTFPLSRFEVIVVDNDKSASAKQVVKQATQRYPELTLRYDIEATPGIPYARNKTVELAVGTLLAFIDDDEWAAHNWLMDLAKSIKTFEADAVLGPVLPLYPVGTHTWVIKSKFFERPRFSTGTSIASKDCRTGNAMVVARRLKSRLPMPFDVRHALSGGEDTDFFKWLEDQGGKFVWCNTAEVNETVPLARQTLRFMLERCFRTSIGYWREEYAVHPKTWAIHKAFAGLIGGSILFLLGSVLLPFGLAQSVRVWTKGMKGLGRVGALTEIVLVGYGEKNNE